MSLNREPGRTSRRILSVSLNWLRSQGQGNVVMVVTCVSLPTSKTGGLTYFLLGQIVTRASARLWATHLRELRVCETYCLL
jgi:hypothetical protein